MEVKPRYPANDYEDPVEDMAWYWAPRCVMRYLLGYPQGDITIAEDGESEYVCPDPPPLISDPHCILIALASLVGPGGGRFGAGPPLTFTGPDMQEVREILTVEYRQHFFPRDSGVISQDDAIQVYWRQAVELLLDPFFVDWALECLREELWRGKGMAAHDIQHLLEDLDARSREPALPPIP